MERHTSLSPSTRRLEATPKYFVSGNADHDAPEVITPEAVYSHTTQYPPKWEPPAHRPSTPPEVAPRGRSCWGRRTICGLAPVVFILLVTLAVVIVAAAVGGGIGGSLAVKNARSEGIAEGRAFCSMNGDTCANPTTATTTITSTSTSAPSTETDAQFTPPGGVTLALDCPSIDGDRLTNGPPGGPNFEYDMECNVDRTFNEEEEGGDIVSLISYSLNDCLRACSVYNRNKRDDKCLAVTFMADLSAIIGTNGGNCYLKSGQGKKEPFEDDSKRNLRVSGLLVEDD